MGIRDQTIKNKFQFFFWQKFSPDEHSPGSIISSLRNNGNSNHEKKYFDVHILNINFNSVAI